ncbi:MAG: methionine adenosyltransferase [Acidimicrobiia bacterium]|nr:methionine adenosyltransferase [Acidimicrobiia bacterium]
MESRPQLFTSESVSMGHPDKVADRISDAVLDHVLAVDPRARVACEVFITGGLIVVGGEISARDLLDDLDEAVEDIARSTVRSIGYRGPGTGFDPDGAEVRIVIQEQAADIARGVDGGEELGAGDQGLMFGYATDDTAELMPLPIVLAHRLVARQSEIRTSGAIEGLRPDAKSQVTVAWDDDGRRRLDSVLLSTQHEPTWNERQDELRDLAVAHIVRPALGEWWHDEVRVLFNPTGRFEMGGPEGDTGLTGRKIIVDTYGGWARHGGGAFSGKDPSKVDRSASYMARHIAKNVVAAGLAAECEVRLSYAIGRAEPTAVSIDTNGTATVPEHLVRSAVDDVFDLTPSGIIATLGLERPIYEPTSFHGHMGRVPGEAGPGTFSWERTDRVDDLRAAIGTPATAGA